MKTISYFVWMLFFLVSSIVVDGTTNYLISMLGLLISLALLNESKP